MSVVSFMSHVQSAGSGAAAAPVTHASQPAPAAQSSHPSPEAVTQQSSPRRIEIADSQNDSRRAETDGRERVLREFPGVELAISDSGMEELQDSRQGSVRQTDDAGEQQSRQTDDRWSPEDFAMDFEPAEIDREELAKEAEAQRAQAQLEAEEASEAEEQEETQREIVSLTGYTGQQIEQLYRQGRISYSDYTTEMEDREELRQKQDNLSVDFQQSMKEAFTRAENLQRGEAEGKIASLQKEDRRQQEDFFLEFRQAVI